MVFKLLEKDKEENCFHDLLMGYQWHQLDCYTKKNWMLNLKFNMTEKIIMHEDSSHSLIWFMIILN